MSNFNPYFFWNSPTAIEKIQYCLKKIAELINDVDFLKKAYETINNVLNEFEQTVKDRVYAVIQQMYEDGELQKIVEDVATPYIEKLLTSVIAKTETLNMRHYWRRIAYTGNNYSRIPEGLHYSNCQGGCCFSRTNQNYIGLIMHNQATKTGQVQIFTEQSANTPVNTFDINSDHSQSLVYNPADDCLYFPFFSVNETPSGLIGKIDLTTNTISTYTLQTSDFDTEIRWWSVKVVEQSDGSYKIYGFKNKGVENKQNTVKIYELDFSNNTATLVDIVKLVDYTTTGYDVFINVNCCINDNYIFVLTARPNTIQVFERTTGEQINQYRLPVWTYDLPFVLDSAYNIGEVEDIEVDNNGAIDLVTLNDLNRIQTFTKTAILTTVTRVYKSNIYRGNTVEKLNSIQNASPATVNFNQVGKVYTLYVDWGQDCPNPAGTRGQPFKTVQEAIEFVNASNTVIAGNIILSSTDYLPCYISTSKSIRINGGTNSTALCGVYVNQCPNLVLTHLRIPQTCELTDSSNAPLYALNSKILLFDILLDKSGTVFGSNLVVCPYDYTAQYSNCIVDTVTTYPSGTPVLSNYAGVVQKTTGNTFPT